jgi:hypothetical protein
MRYLQSFVSGAKGIEQWDWFLCTGCHTTYEYRQRTGKLRVVDATGV